MDLDKNGEKIKGIKCSHIFKLFNGAKIIKIY